jgi:hypothetical protein
MLYGVVKQVKVGDPVMVPMRECEPGVNSVVWA